MEIESELKLETTAKHLAAIAEHPLINMARASESQTQLYATYYDTPDYQLRDMGIGFRTRREGERWVQTVKSKGKASAGLYQRKEWNMEVAENKPDYTKLYTCELGKLFADSELRASVKPFFITDIQRTIINLEFPGGNKVELALDSGVVNGNGKSNPIHEAELELKAGDPNILYEIGLKLLETIPMRIGSKSKAQS